MNLSNFVRQHLAAFRALLVLTVITGLAYPLFIWLVAQVPGLHDKGNGSIIEVNGKPVGRRLIGQLFTDKDGNALPPYFQRRPSAAGNGYDPLSTSASNLGPESIVDTPADPSQPKDSNGSKASLLTLAGARLAVVGPRGARGNVVHPTKVVSVNEPCETTPRPFLNTYEGVRVDCAKFGEDYTIGQIVPIRGAAPADSAVPADAITASGSGLDPHISPAYADLQVKRVAKARGVSPDQVRQLVLANQDGRVLGFIGEATVNVLQ